MNFSSKERGVDLGAGVNLQVCFRTAIASRCHIVGLYPWSPLCGIRLPYLKEVFFMDKINSISVSKSGYWHKAARELRNPKSIVFAGLTIALGTILTGFGYIPISLNLRISSAFLVFALGSMIFGPVSGLVTGLAFDIVGSLIKPPSVFFPGYTLSTMLEFFIYGLFFYNCQISILRIVAAKFIINFGIHVGLGSLWSMILYGKGYYFFFAKGIIKNIIMLPIEVIMIVLLFQIFIPILVKSGVIPKQKKKYIPII